MGFMSDAKQQSDYQADLLGYHLGLLDDAERSRFESESMDSARLQADCGSLERILAPLNCDVLPRPTAGFCDRILDAVDSTPVSLRFPKGVLAAPAAQQAATGGGSLFSMRELMGIAAAIAMFAGIFVPGYYTARQTAQKVACANKLRTIGNGVANYAEMYGNNLPFAGFVSPDAKWAASGDSDQDRVVRNSRHAWRLVDGNFVSADSFICPGAEGDFPMRAANLDAYSDFADPRNNSFATNFIDRPFERGVFQGNSPLAACMTPLVDQNRQLVPEGAAQNSWNHGKAAGQNVLRANISVLFFNTPECGLNNDDIYRVRGIKKHTGTERPADPEDALLIP